MNSPRKDFNVVVIGASAGGVETLTSLFKVLPQELDAAVFVVLHIPAHSPSELDRILAAVTAMAVDGEAIRAGRVYVASADRHLMVGDGVVRVTRGPKECRVRPAVDVLFRSVAVAFGPRAIGVILSGTLDDGTAGLWTVKDRGGKALVQDPAEAMYASMPESAIKHVAVDFVGPVQALAAEIVRLTAQPAIAVPSRPASQRQQLENLIANEGNALENGVMQLGELSQYTCPDCHGVLVQVKEGSIVRFRCHTGHAFSIKTLLAEVNDSIDNGLWATIRAVEELLLLLRQMCDLAKQHNAGDEAKRCERQAMNLEKHIRTLRDLVLDPQLFGHDADT